MKRANGPNKKIKELKDAQKAILNLLEDLEKERETLKIAKAKDEAILASIGDGLVAMGKDGNIFLVNRIFEAILGWKESEVQGKFLSQIMPIVDEKGKQIPESKRLINKILKERTTKVLNTTGYYKRKDGTFFPAAITVSPIILGKNLIGAVKIFRDITREREIDRMQSEFISVASHQLRTPLTGIQWVIERFLKKEKNLSEKGKEYLNDIHNSFQRLAKLVDLLLNVSRIEEGEVSISPKQLEIVEFIKDYLDGCVPLSAKKNITLIFEKHPKTLQALTDVRAFHTIIEVIISNALEYTLGGGRVEVSLEKKDPSTSSGQATFLFIVSDNGIGIPKEEQATIFNKFIRGTNAKLIKTDGIGFGLYFAKQTVGFLQGKIWFESKENKGTTFFVELPIKVRSKKGSKGLA